LSRPPRRIVLVASQLGLGGTERQVALLAAGLHDRGHDVVVVLLFAEGWHADALRDRAVPMIGPLARTGRAAPLLAFWRLVVLLRRLRPDVVQAYLWAACALAGPAALVARVPLRVAGRRSLSNWKRGRPAVVLLERCTNPSFHVFVANARAVAEDVVRTERLPGERVEVIHNALDPAAFVSGPDPEDAPGAGVPRPLVLCIANLIDYKGHVHLLEAQRRLRDEGTEIGLLLAGEGPARHQIQELVGRLSLPTRLLGARADVGALLRCVDIVVLPSLHEGMSNALMEALAAGRAVVATDVGGNREVVGDAGLLCRAADPAALAEALARLVEDETLRNALGTRARRRAEEMFGLDVMIERYLNLWESRLADRQVTYRVRGDRGEGARERAAGD